MGSANVSAETPWSVTRITPPRFGFVAMPWIALRRISWLSPISLRPKRSVTSSVPRTFPAILREMPLTLSISAMTPTVFRMPADPSLRG